MKSSMATDLSVHPAGCLDRVMRGDQPPDAVLLLGAGASVKSGVPLAGQMVSMAAKWSFCREHGLNFDDPSITLSDWKPWLNQQSWFDSDRPLEEQYPQAIQRLLHPRESRRAFFLRALASATRPSPGYEALARLVAARRVRHVLVVNFDDLVARACMADRAVLHIATIRSADDLREFSTDPLYPQVVYLHGSVGRYQDRNLEEETKVLDSDIREAVLPVLRDHPLVVLGYRGAEASVMIDLLQRGAESTYGFRHGVYWCVLPGAAETLHPYVLQLAERLETNFRLVEIPGFDDALTGWAAGATPARIPEFAASADEPDIPDLRAAGRLNDTPLDTRLAEEKLNAYAQSLGVIASTAADPEAWERWLTEVRLVRPTQDGPQVTRAGRLLFARDDVTLLELRGEETFVPIAGNVFEILDKTLEAIEDFNEPYRLKGPVSQDVRRFDPRAVKELVVNALAHRDYDMPRPIRLGISRRELTVVSPGGLIGGLTVDQLGQPYARAYRNHIVADVLYGAGAMDKKGSGLADVVRWTRQAGGEATFGLSEDGQTFIASLRARDLDPDPTTGTATTEVEHFTANILEVEIAAPVRSAATTHSYRREIYDLHPNESLPAFAMQPGRITTFSDLLEGPLAPDVQGEVSLTPADEMSRDPDSERVLVQLLNSTMFAWARHRGLRSDPGNLRLWFPRDDDGAREITYRARVREATRTVTKPKVSRSTGDVRYWEHQAVRFRFRRYGDSWALHLNPCFVFTRDGHSDLLTGPRVGPLATRRAARDFNPQVENDLFFWLWVLTAGEGTAFIDDGAVSIRPGFVSCDVVDAPSPIGPGGPGEESEVSDDGLEETDELTEEIAAIAADSDDEDA
jgi:hypothetical protein